MRKLLAIVNPASANGSTARFWRQARKDLSAAGLEVDEAITTGPGDATSLAHSATSQGYSAVLYVGGDGTANEVANGLLSLPPHSRPPLACLPRGTGADLARSLHLRPGVEGAIERLLRWQERRIDVAESRFVGHNGSPQERYFLNIADAGLGGYVAEHVDTRSKALGGFASFLWAVLASFASFEKRETRVSVDGVVRFEGRLTSVVVANGAFFGGGMHMAPEAVLDDGLLDIVVIGDVSKRDLVASLHRLYRGTHLTHPKIDSFQGREVLVEGPGHIPLEMDGEQPGDAPWRVRVVPGALRVLI